ncbi:sensor histidine kinase [Microvirga pudoricolor]|uniref:sensor histidine kinase n=1 Tax=Microvirga pudoricolor TaxID=2778729 RepID=UPI00194E4D31|nr:HAMP domain-containing sensor histidine kinase [Microvirga pudoricolor]MBM6596232.1 HAMP domain-containing histidine kinase [Microvirga pudoricolor]
MKANAPTFLRRVAGTTGLSGRLLVLTVLFVMVAEVLIYLPSVASFRYNWLNDRLAAARVAALVLDAAPDETLSGEVEMSLLEGVGAKAIAVRGGERRRLLASEDVPAEIHKVVDLRHPTWPELLSDALETLLSPPGNVIRVVGAAGMDVDLVEMIFDEGPLRQAMLEFSRNLLLLTLIISGITAGLLYFALQWVIVRPVRRLSGNIAAFASHPEDAARVIEPTGRSDEIGLAEEALAQMETTLAGELRQKRRLAELGLAVSKINHELRNMLTTAQLLTERLDRVNDETAQRVAPRLVATLDRAISFCEATLAYGRATEPLPQRRMMPLRPLMEELAHLTELSPAGGIAFEARVPDGLMIDADREQLTRILVNLVRNAVQALSQAGATDGEPRIIITAKRERREVTIRVEDNGPGVPERVREGLFGVFQSASPTGGTGLGLAITAELVHLHGGTISLADTVTGSCFCFTIPDRSGRRKEV